MTDMDIAASIDGIDERPFVFENGDFRFFPILPSDARVFGSEPLTGTILFLSHRTKSR